MSDLDHFDLIPIHMDPQTKAVYPQKQSRALATEVHLLNHLHLALLNLELPPQAPPNAIAIVPPPPVPVNPRRTAQITKLRDQGNDAFKKQKYADAVKFYSQGIELAIQRPLWEPSPLAREEVAGLLSNRAQGYMSMGMWAEGGVDAEASVEARRAGNAKAWWRRGKCLMEMSRYEEALDWIEKGLEAEGDGEAELKDLRKDIEEKLLAASKA